jgi:hypothetical protein
MSETNDGVALVHIDEVQGQRQDKQLVELLSRCVSTGIKIYNFPHWEDPAKCLEPFKEHIITIGYRGGKIGKNDYVLFLDGKLRMMEDGIERVAIAGQSTMLCVADLCKILGGNSNPRDLYTAEYLGWEEEVYQRVLKKHISHRILPDMVM